MTVLMSADLFRGELRARRKPVGGVYRVSVMQSAPVTQIRPLRSQTPAETPRRRRNCVT